MLKPSMQELLSKVNNRYLLVNLTAQRARDLSDQVDVTGEALEEKSVKLALDEIVAGSIVYRSGSRADMMPVKGIPGELSGSFSLVLDEEELAEDSEQEEALEEEDE